MSSGPRVGVIGAGQLAQMMCEPARALGISLTVFTSSADDSAAQVLPFVIGDYKSLEEVLAFARTCDLITFEHELIPREVIEAVEGEGIAVYPSSRAFKFGQDKALMRAKLVHYPSPQHSVVATAEEVSTFPVIAKAISGGYDGRGVFKVSDSHELEEIISHTTPLLIEELMDFEAEIAVMVARSVSGQIASWHPVETVQDNGICIQTITPARVLTEAQSIEARKMAESIAELIEVVGVMAVEMFLCDGKLIINELALRPHNSGHWTIEGSATSQFEQHLRAICGMPLGSTELIAPYAVMGNILGGEVANPFLQAHVVSALDPEIKVHDYKKEFRVGRKIGHVTQIGADLIHLTHSITSAQTLMMKS